MQVISASDFFFFFYAKLSCRKNIYLDVGFSLNVLVIFFVTRKKDECVT